MPFVPAGTPRHTVAQFEQRLVPPQDGCDAELALHCDVHAADLDLDAATVRWLLFLSNVSLVPGMPSVIITRDTVGVVLAYSRTGLRSPRVPKARSCLVRLPKHAHV